MLESEAGRPFIDWLLLKLALLWFHQLFLHFRTFCFLPNLFTWFCEFHYNVRCSFHGNINFMSHKYGFPYLRKPCYLGHGESDNVISKAAYVYFLTWTQLSAAFGILLHSTRCLYNNNNNTLVFNDKHNGHHSLSCKQ